MSTLSGAPLEQLNPGKAIVLRGYQVAWSPVSGIGHSKSNAKDISLLAAVRMAPEFPAAPVDPGLVRFPASRAYPPHGSAEKSRWRQVELYPVKDCDIGWICFHSRRLAHLNSFSRAQPFLFTDFCFPQILSDIERQSLPIVISPRCGSRDNFRLARHPPTICALHIPMFRVFPFSAG